jgi:hypothetical protein
MVCHITQYLTYARSSQGLLKGQCTTTVLLFYLRIIVVLSVRKMYLIEIKL